MEIDIEKLAEQNPWWKEKEAIERDYDIEKWSARRYKWVPRFIDEIGLEPFALHILLGPRQTGKTTAVKLLIRKLLKENDARGVFYFNCEELGSFEELIEVIGAYLYYRESCGLTKSLIILDEVTSPKEWYRGIKSLIDKGRLKNDVVLLTGSSSIAVKREVELFPGRRGKGRDFVLLPLSFRGFLGVVNPKLCEKIKPISTIGELEKKTAAAMPYLGELNKELSKFMKYGGFPLSVEAVGGDNEEAKRTCLSWIKTAVLKAERSDLIARQVLSAMIEKMPSPMSWEGVSKEIEIKSPKTVAAYADLLKSMFSLIVLYNVDVSGKRIRFGKNKKVHIADPLLLEVFEGWCLTSAKNRENLLAETLVVSHLSRMFPERIFFWKNGFEIDAVVLDKGSLLGFEVKWSENPEAKRSLPQLKSFVLITKRDFSPKPLAVPLAVFLSLLDA
ncbi:MAG: ATP-binding protein [Candidatus Micrarchaeota archaeon]